MVNISVVVLAKEDDKLVPATESTELQRLFGVVTGIFPEMFVS